MDDLCRYAGRPFAFIFRYVRRRALSHAVIADGGARARSAVPSRRNTA